MPDFLRRFLLRMAVSLPIVASYMAVVRANGSREQRHRQLLLPVVAVVTIFITIPLLKQWTDLLARLRSFVAMYVPFLLNFDVNPSIELAFNVAFLSFFAGIKLAYGRIVKLLAPIFDAVFARLIGQFYRYDNTYQLWHLRRESQGVRMILRNLFFATAALSVLFYGITGLNGQTIASQNGFYPCFVILPIGELWFALNGMTKEEFDSSIEVDTEQEKRIFGYAALQNALKHYFEERLLHNSAHGKRGASTDSHLDQCERLINSTNHEERVAGSYFRALLDEGLVGAGENEGTYDELSYDRMLDTVRLLQGQSVLFASPFYRDFVPYIFLPINSQLMKNRKVLFICGTDDAQQRVMDYIYEGVSFVTNFPEMWLVDEITQDGKVNTDIGLMSYVSLDDTLLIANNRSFFERVGMVVIIDPSSLMATYQLGLGMLASELSRGEQVTYCAFDRNSDGLVDSLSHALRTHLVEVGATEYANSDSFGMFWQVDGDQLQNRLLPGVSHYLGMGSEIGLVALKNQVDSVAWAAHDAVPLADMRWILGQYYGEAFGFAELPQEQAQVDEHFEFCEDLWSMTRKPRRFVVVEDEYNNMFEAYRQYATRGAQESFVNVLVPSYLLYDYMASNSDIFSVDPKAIPSIAPDYAKSERNAIFSIVLEMLQTGRGFTEDELTDRLRYVGVQLQRKPGENAILEELKSLIAEHFEVPVDHRGTKGGGDEYANTVESALRYELREDYDITLRRMVRYATYWLDTKIVDANEVLYRSFGGLRNVPLITEMPDGNTRVLGSRLSSLVCQSWLPGQYVTFDGKYYEVLSISLPLSARDRGAVLLRRAADHFQRRRYYRQLRTYEVGIVEGEEDLTKHRTLGEGIEVRIERADIAVHTRAYLTMARRGDLATAHKTTIIQDDGTGLSGDLRGRGNTLSMTIPVRRYRNKDVLRLILSDASPVVARTIATVMSELFVTIFPKDHQYLSVLTASSKSCDLPEGVLNELVSMSQPDNLETSRYLELADNEILIVEDSQVDIGLLSAVDRNLQRILETVWDYLDWHEDMMSGRIVEDPVFEPGEPPEIVIPESKGIIQRVKDFFPQLFGRKKTE